MSHPPRLRDNSPVDSLDLESDSPSPPDSLDFLDNDPLPHPGSERLSQDAALLMLGHARCAVQQYSELPDLFSHLRKLMDDSVEACKNPNNVIKAVVDGMIRTERNIIQQYNEGKLGAPDKMYKPDASSQAFRQTFDFGAIADMDAMFPIRISAKIFEVPFAQPEALDPSTVSEEVRNTDERHIDMPKKSISPIIARNGSKSRQIRPVKPRIEQQRKFTGAITTSTEFPEGNLTAAEIIAFGPEWLKSLDVIERFISNGAKAAILSYMINTLRDMSSHGEIEGNTISMAMQRAVEGRPEERYKDWTIARHKAPKDWDASDLSVAGFRVPEKGKKSGRQSFPKKDTTNEDKDTQVSIPFYRLAHGVKQMPSGFDALDLTRCVEYHVTHKDEVWMFPDQFADLVDHLGGPKEVQKMNEDAEVFARWNQDRRTSLIEARDAKMIASTRATSAPPSVLVKRAIDYPLLETPAKRAKLAFGPSGKGKSVKEEGTDAT